MSTTFCIEVSDCGQEEEGVLTRSFSGLAHALKFEKMQVSKVLSNSLQLSLDSPGKAIGRELVVQKVVQESKLLAKREDGRATLYESMVSNLVEPVELFSIASTSGDHASCNPLLSPS
jgi:hypothetical protein